jgi:hypothetical protein
MTPDMRKAEARVHALAWQCAAQKMLPTAAMDNETARLHRSLAALARKVGESYAALSEGTHPINRTALNNLEG